jgi:molecular chaperone DnaK (HSP70)
MSWLRCLQPASCACGQRQVGQALNVAIAVGCSRYKDPTIADLKYAHQDAVNFVEQLAEVTDIPDEYRFELHDARSESQMLPTYANVIDVLSEAARALTEQVDTLFFFFSGHGCHSAAMDADFLLFSNSREEDLEQTSLKFEFIYRKLRAFKARHTVLFLDACRGIVGGKSLETLPEPDIETLCPEGMVTFWSCEPRHLSYESDKLRMGVFTAAICAGLSESGRCTTVEDLDVYLGSAVPDMSRQSGTPLQKPHSRVEPLHVKNLEIVSPAIRRIWNAATPFGRELRVQRPAATISVPANPLVAVDFGTTSSSIAVTDLDGTIRVVPDAAGRSLIPSVVAFTEEFDYVVGADAVQHELHSPTRAVRNVKRNIGTDHEFRIADRVFNPEVVSSLILRSLREMAAEATGQSIFRCMVAYPANFDTRQVNSLLRALHLAGFEVGRMVGEPNIAAVLALREWGQEWGNKDHEVLIVDLGGGTFDVALATVGDGIVEITSVAGNNQLGGLDYDDAIARLLHDRLLAVEPDLIVTDTLLAEIRFEAERAKRVLSIGEDTTIVFNLPTPYGLKDTLLQLTREDVRCAVADLDRMVVEVLDDLFSNNDVPGQETGQRETKKLYRSVRPEQIDLVMLTGMGGKIFTMANAIRSVGVHADITSLHQELAVVRGLAEYANVLTGSNREMLLLDLTHRSVGIRLNVAVEAIIGQRGQEPDEIEALNAGEELVIIDHFTTIPNRRTVTLRLAANAAKPLAVTVIEESRTSGSYVDIGHIKIELPDGDKELQLTFDIDVNNMMCLAIRHPETDVERIFQLTQLYREVQLWDANKQELSSAKVTKVYPDEIVETSMRPEVSPVDRG